MILCEFNCNCDVYVILVSVLLFDHSFGKMVTIKSLLQLNPPWLYQARKRLQQMVGSFGTFSA